MNTPVRPLLSFDPINMVASSSRPAQDIDAPTAPVLCSALSSSVVSSRCSMDSPPPFMDIPSIDAREKAVSIVPSSPRPRFPPRGGRSPPSAPSSTSSPALGPVPGYPQAAAPVGRLPPADDDAFTSSDFEEVESDSSSLEWDGRARFVEVWAGPGRPEVEDLPSHTSPLRLRLSKSPTWPRPSRCPKACSSAPACGAASLLTWGQCCLGACLDAPIR